MEPFNIDALLEKYFEGNTTIQEENQINKYFSSSNVTLNLQHYKPLFQCFNEQKMVSYEKNINVKSNYKIFWMAFAASIALIFGLGTFLYINNNSNTASNDLGSYESPEVAFQETQKALQMLSNNVNVGINSVAYFKEYQNTKEIIFVN